MFKGLPRAVFDRSVQTHQTDRYNKGFDSWDHLVAMLYGQLSGASSLRVLQEGFNQHRRHHYHLGTAQLRRSTLADANAKRNPQIFADTAQALMQVAGRRVRKERQQMLYLLDSTSIALRGRGFEWTAGSATRTPGLKLHLLVAGGAALPVHYCITPANVNDMDVGRKLALEAGATYVFDKGYCDYNWWSRIDAARARFVTRLKRNAALRTERQLPVDPCEAHILSDTLARFAHRHSRGGHRNLYTGVIRRIEVARAGEESLVLVTNDLEAPAAQIAQLYKDRWQIELFFKWIKQHLSVKRFLGRSANAVCIQLLTALIAYLLVLIYNATHGKATLWMTLAELRGGLFHRPQTEESRWRRRRQQQAYIESVQPGLFT